MALRVEEDEARPWTQLQLLYAACDPAGWDACALRGEPWPPVLYILPTTVWSDFSKWRWRAWDKWLRNYSLGIVPYREPSRPRPQSLDEQQLAVLETVALWAGMTSRQRDVWIACDGNLMSQRVVANVLEISQPMVNRHRTNARRRMGGVIAPGFRGVRDSDPDAEGSHTRLRRLFRQHGFTKLSRR
jgi:DNA-binding CsgD family transcriptional regulator